MEAILRKNQTKKIRIRNDLFRVWESSGKWKVSRTKSKIIITRKNQYIYIYIYIY